MASPGGASPCGACKFLRRRCSTDCVFAPHFCSEQGPARFAAIHRVFGASNASKLLLRVPPHDRCEGAVTMAYDEAQARMGDPVSGCVGHIFALQQQVASLQVQLMQANALLEQKAAVSSSASENQQWLENVSSGDHGRSYGHELSLSPQSSPDGVDLHPCSGSTDWYHHQNAGVLLSGGWNFDHYEPMVQMAATETRANPSSLCHG